MGLFRGKTSQPWPFADRIKAQNRIVDNYYRHWTEHQLDPSVGLYSFRRVAINDAIKKVEDGSTDSMSAAMEVMANPGEAEQFVHLVRIGRANELRAYQVLEAHDDAWRRVIGDSLMEMTCKYEQIVASDLENYTLQGECLRGVKNLVDDEGIWKSLMVVSERKRGGDIIVERLMS